MILQLVSPSSEQTTPSSETQVDRAYQKLAAKVLELVNQGEFVLGQRLPSERALAERFDVSRTLLREAIIALELQGFVEVRGGSGIYVCQAPAVAQPAPVAQSVGAGPFELLRARCVIEGEIAAVAASTRSDAHLDRILGALVAMREQMDDKDANAAADRQFHQYIAESTGNSVLLQTVSNLWDMARGPLWDQLEQHFHSPELRLQSQSDHQRIFGAIAAGQAEAARLAMRAHLERVIAEFAQSWR